MNLFVLLSLYTIPEKPAAEISLHKITLKLLQCLFVFAEVEVDISKHVNVLAHTEIVVF